jgi:hypothetical protein
VTTQWQGGKQVIVRPEDVEAASRDSHASLERAVDISMDSVRLQLTSHSTEKGYWGQSPGGSKTFDFGLIVGCQFKKMVLTVRSGVRSS